jgi:hypothetical protein
VLHRNELASSSLADTIPDLDVFTHARDALPAALEGRTPTELLADGKKRLAALASSEVPRGMAEGWADARRASFEALASGTASGEGRLMWDATRNPWFPVDMESNRRDDR